MHLLGSNAIATPLGVGASSEWMIATNVIPFFHRKSRRRNDRKKPESITHLPFWGICRGGPSETPQQLAYDIIVPKRMTKSRNKDGNCAQRMRDQNFAKITPKCGQLLMQAYAKSAQDAATMDPPIDRPDGTMFGTAGPNSRATGCCAR